MNSSFRDGVQYAWDSTSIKLFEDCPYKYKLRMIDNWQPRRKSVHLLFGGWYATALEHFYKYLAEGNSHDDALVRVVREALEATWSREIDPASELPVGPWVSDHNTKTRENLIRTIIWYVDEFATDTVSTVIRADGKPAVEYSFALEVDDGIIFSGHIDRLGTYGDDVYVLDQKTTGSTVSSNYFDSYNPDTQMSMYTFAGQIIYKTKVRGVIIDAAQIAVGFTRFTRGFTFRDAASLEEWYNFTLDRIALAQDYTRREHFPMNPGSCHKYNGCEFRNVCSRSPTVREHFLAADFVKGEPWDPLKRR